MNINDCKKYEPIFNAWYVKGLLGQGSFGTVFEIQKEEFGEVYSSALKVITIPQNDDEIENMRLDGEGEEQIKKYYDNVVREIIGELAIMSELKGNSNIVSYEDHTVVRHEDGIGYDVLIRMELLTPLLRYRSEHDMSQRDVAKLGIDICKALELCQKNNVIHRDIKPANIFVAKSGNFKLGDFGIARTIEKTNSDLSRKGTFSYMAPEVYKGEPYGQTVDIYSLGIVMYSMLNGNRMPFLPPLPHEITHSLKEQALIRRMNGDPVPALAGVNARLMEVILRACSFRKSERYQSASEMRRALEKAYAYIDNEDEDRTELMTDNIMDVEETEATPIFDEYISPDGNGERTEDMRSGSYRQSGSMGQSGSVNTGGSMSGTGSGQRGQGKKSRSLIIVLCVILALLLCLCAVFLIKKAGNPSSEDIDVEDIAITHWDWDLTDSGRNNGDGTYSFDIIMTVDNNSDVDITGLAFKPKSFTEAPITNKEEGYEEDAPFYAEGYIPAEDSGVMYAHCTITAAEYEQDRKSGQRPRVANNEIIKAYPYRGEEDYVQPTGYIMEKYGPDLNYYRVKIDNPNDSVIHKDSVIIALDLKDDGGIKYSSAQGRVDKEIEAGGSREIPKAFDDPGLYDKKEMFTLYVVDGDYGDDKYYSDEYKEEYED